MGAANIRNATQDDAAFLGWSILASSRGHLPRGWFEIAMRQPEDYCLEFLRRLTVSTVRSRWHYSRFLVAEVNAEPVAALCAFRFGEACMISPLAITEALQSLGVPPKEHAELWKHGAYVFTCTARPDNDCWVIESAASLPAYRQYGYTSALIARALEDACALGLREAETMVIIGNTSSARMVEKAGFRCAGDLCHPDFEAATGAPGQRRFVKALR